MRIDPHTACPVCPIVVRHLFDCAAVLVLMLERESLPADVAHRLVEPLATTKIALGMLSPWVDAHLADQTHAQSGELVTARAPELETPAPKGDR